MAGVQVEHGDILVAGLSRDFSEGFKILLIDDVILRAVN